METDNATNDEKPYNNHHYFGELRCILSLVAIVIEYLCTKVFLADIKVEYCTNTYWAEEANNTRLAPMFNLVDASVH